MLSKIRFILTRFEKNKLIILFIGTLFLALLETFSIGIIIPIMDLFVNQDKIQTSRVLQWFYRLIGAQDNISFLIVLIITAIILFIAKSLFTIFILYKQGRIAYDINVRLTTRVLASYLNMPYSFHLENNSAIMFKNTNTSVNSFCNQFLFSLIIVGTEITILLAISLLLIFLYPLATLLLGGVIAIATMIVNFFLKKKIGSYSFQRMKAAEQIHKFGLEALQAVKEVKIYDAQRFFVERYSQAWKRHADSLVKFSIASGLPRFILDMIMWVSMLIVLLVSIHFHKTISELIPVLTAFALAILKILPSTHKIFMNFNSIRYYSDTLDIVYGILKGDISREILEKVESTDVGILQESEALRLEKMSFRYRTAPACIFKEFSLVIPKFKTTAFAGETGAGKSTLIDILMGLLIPDKGALYYGQMAITPANIIEYRKKIGYVPQYIFLTDDTIEANIAFGITSDKIDYVQLKRVIQISQLESLVEGLTEGTKTEVGEKGVRLSGGQRQRIGIARALYRNPEILIMDEATSALDGYTESEVNKAIRNLCGKLTIIIIAHRLSTIEYADIIYVMDRGSIVDQGSFKELLEKSFTFKKLANQTLT